MRCQAGERAWRKGKEAEIQTTGARKSSGCVYLELLSSLAASQRERRWEVVEAFIKCSSGPGETLVNVPIISGVVRRRALCPNDSCLMHLRSPCHLTSPLEVVGRGGMAGGSHKTHKGPKRPRSYSSPALHLLNMGGRAARCCVISPVPSPPYPLHPHPAALHGAEVEGGPGPTVGLSKALCYFASDSNS